METPFFKNGIAGLENDSRRPQSHSRGLDEEVVCRLIALKHAHGSWGPKKIQALYHRQHPQKSLPSLSSVKRVFERAGLVKHRKKRPQSSTGRIHHGVKAEQNNDVWTVDFKGWWKTLSGSRYEPLTVRDEFSRKIFAVDILANTRTECVQSIFRKLFMMYGLPKYIRSDNGAPFAHNQSLLGLTRLSVWWLSLGIDLERNRPGKPQDNGAHERMHRDIRAELQTIGRELSQESFDLWKEEYNSIRPHESLGMRSPDDVYKNSKRLYTPELENAEIDYGMMETRKVHKVTGQIIYRGINYSLSRALGGRQVGLKMTQNHGECLREVWFSNQHLCNLNLDLATVEHLSKSEKKADKRTSKCNL